MFKNLIPKILFISCSLLSLTACRVVHLDKNGNPIIPMSATASESFTNMTPKSIVDKIWPKVILDADNHSIELSKIKNNKSLISFVRVKGIIKQLHHSEIKEYFVFKSHNGREINLQVGNIIRGNSIRDAISFISFDMFKNQIQFARLSKELNKKAMSFIPQPYSKLVGRNVSVLAAITFKDNKIVYAVPVEIKGEVL